MEAIKALTQRVSIAKLTAPGPTDAQLKCLRQAALRAADHANLRPWRFLEVSGHRREDLGECFAQAALAEEPGLNDAQLARFRAMPLRAPMMIIAIAKLADHPKVPHSEQLMSAACCVQNMLNAAFAMGLGAYWRTGALAQNRHLYKALGLSADEEIVGFLYVGSPESPPKAPPAVVAENFFDQW